MITTTDLLKTHISKFNFHDNLFNVIFRQDHEHAAQRIQATNQLKQQIETNKRLKDIQSKLKSQEDERIREQLLRSSPNYSFGKRIHALRIMLTLP